MHRKYFDLKTSNLPSSSQPRCQNENLIPLEREIGVDYNVNHKPWSRIWHMDKVYLMTNIDLYHWSDFQQLWVNWSGL